MDGTLTTAGASAAVLLGVLLVALPRRYAVAPLLAGASYIPLGQAFVALGVARDRYRITPYGDGTPLVPAPRGVRHPENDRAELTISGLPWPPRGYREVVMRCVVSGRMLVPVDKP